MSGQLDHSRPGQPDPLQPDPAQYLAELTNSLGLDEAECVLRGLTAALSGHLVTVVHHLQTPGVQQDGVAEVEVASAYLISLSFLEKDLPCLDIKHLDTAGPRVEIQVEVPLET